MTALLRKNLYLFSLIGIGFCFAFAQSAPDNSQSRKTLIKFSHTFHLNTVGTECLSCHSTVTQSVLAADNNLGKRTACTTCHDGETVGNECEKCHYDPEQTVPLPNPKRTLMFNHKSHLAAEKELSCGKCHRGLNTVDYAGIKNLPSMYDCKGCHITGVSTLNCYQCHKETQYLWPESHTADWEYNHSIAVNEQREDCTLCHSNDYCTECHTAPIRPVK